MNKQDSDAAALVLREGCVQRSEGSVRAALLQRCCGVGEMGKAKWEVNIDPILPVLGTSVRL